jgi:hypothetical protein
MSELPSEAAAAITTTEIIAPAIMRLLFVIHLWVYGMGHLPQGQNDTG